MHREHHRLALVVIAIAQLMVMLDLTIVNVALPAIQRDLHFTLTNLTWVIDAYVLVFGGLLILGGRTGDIFGRRRMFIIGIAIFAAASFAGGFAESQGMLIVARAVQGVGAAIASPTALALVAVTFREGAERNRAMAVYASMTAAGGALGLVSGGALTQASWRWVFFVNVPIALVALVLAPFVLPRLDGHGGRLDVAGALTVSLGVAAFVFGIVRAPTSGWGSSQTLGSIAVAVVLLAGFVVIEHRSPVPLIPLGFLRHRNRTGGYAVMALFGATMLSLLYFLTQFLQEEMGYSSLRAGLSYTPVPIMVATTSVLVSKNVARIGLRPLIVVGPALVMTGVAWASLLRPGDSYLHVLGPLVVFGLGAGCSLVPLTLNAVSSVSNHEQGLASSLLNMSQQIGGSVGLAVLVTVAATVRAHHLTSGASASAAATASVHDTLRVGAGFSLAAFLIALAVVRPPQRRAGSTSGDDVVPAVGVTPLITD